MAATLVHCFECVNKEQVIASLKTQNEELRKDKERLDWLEDKLDKFQLGYYWDDKLLVWKRYPLRGAIDANRQPPSDGERKV
jgi:hypothetical protein